mgnify:CR=1 FL=1
MQTAIRLESAHIESLKRLATRLRLFQTRGAGTGETPSVSAVIRKLAELADNEEFIVVVEQFLNKKN